MTLMIMVFFMTFVFNGWGLTISFFEFVHITTRTGLVGGFLSSVFFIYHGFLILPGVERSDLYFLDLFLLFPWTHWAVALALILWLV